MHPYTIFRVSVKVAGKMVTASNIGHECAQKERDKRHDMQHALWEVCGVLSK